jgi:hypothetical protein
MIANRASARWFCGGLVCALCVLGGLSLAWCQTANPELRSDDADRFVLKDQNVAAMDSEIAPSDNRSAANDISAFCQITPCTSLMDSNASLEWPLRGAYSVAGDVVQPLMHLLKETKSSVDLEPQYYRDTVGNSTFKLKSDLAISVANFKLNLTSRHADARGSVGYRQSDEVLLGFSSNPRETIWVGGGIGSAFINHHSGSFIGNFATAFELQHTWVTASASRDVVDTTAETIASRILETNFLFSARRNLFHGVMAQIDYHFEEFSDFNHANELQPALSYLVHLGPVDDTIGYRFHFVDFARVTSHGYATPAGLIENDGFSQIAFSREHFFANAEVSAGRRSFSTNGYPSSDLIVAGNLRAGISLTERLKLELQSEGGDYQVGLPAPWRYFMIGLKTSYAF